MFNLELGDRVKTRRGDEGKIIKFYGIDGDGVVIERDDGTTFTACIQACTKVE